MKFSQLFTKTTKSVSAEETSKNAQLLTKAGYIYKELAGVYTYLPLGLRVLNKINQIIREEMNAIDGQEVQMTALQNKDIWEATDRWDESKIDVWFKTKLNSGSDMGLGFTHEEPITNFMKQHIHSYKDLPVYAYQIQTKFRNETRAKSGIMRCREFLMKDLYSFSLDKESHDEYYKKVWDAYNKIFARVGPGDHTFVTFASGGIFSKFSHEFQTLCESGEDLVYLDRKKNIAVNKEVLNDEVLASLDIKREDLEEHKAVEVGNIFTLGTRFSDALSLNYANEAGEKIPVFMGSYGIGPGRVMGTIVEVFSDEKGIIWPENIAPYEFHIILIGKNAETAMQANKLYEQMKAKGVEVLFDDRQGIGAGQKLGDADLIGIPKRLLVSDKSIEKGGVELSYRAKEGFEIVKFADLV